MRHLVIVDGRVTQRLTSESAALAQARFIRGGARPNQTVTVKRDDARGTVVWTEQDW